MSMGDNVASASLQFGSKAVEVGGHLAIKTIDVIAKLLEALIAKAKADRANKAVKARDLKDLKPGAVSLKKLKENARRTGDLVVFSQQGISREDKAYIVAKAKQYGIPVAFNQSDDKDCIYPQVRKTDLPVFQKICTEMMDSKLAERPKDFKAFKINGWEQPFITNELNKFDVPANFFNTSKGERICFYDNKYDKVMKIVTGEVHRKCAEVEADLSFSKSEDGFYTLKSASTGEAISFDELPTQDELSEQFQAKFGYDENKSKIACAKFGEECLSAEEKTLFFSEDPQRDFTEINGYISVEGEDIRCKEYTCWRLTPKTDENPRIVFSDTNGNFAVLEPEKMSAKQMQDTLREHLEIEDAATLSALTDKAQKVSDYYITEQNTVLDADFRKSSFDMTDPKVVEGMRWTDADGQVYTKSQPVDSIHNEIERTEKDEFTVKSTVTSTAKDADGIECRSTDSRELMLSFSDKKNAIAELKEMYKEQGIPDHAATQMAKDVFAKAKAQPVEKVVLLEEVRAESIKVSYAGRNANIPIGDRDKAVADICDKYGVSKEVSEQILARAQQHKDAAVMQTNQGIESGRTLEAAKQNILMHQAQKFYLNSVFDRMTDRDELARDTIIVCSANNPANYIQCTGSHNGERVVHQYDVYKDGMQQQAADRFGTNGTFTDEFSKDTDGKAVRVQLENGKTTSYWNALKQDMAEKSGIESDQVLVFDSKEEFDRYQEDMAMVENAQTDALSAAETNLDANTAVNGAAAGVPDAPELAKPEAPDLPEAPKIEVPKIDIPARGGR